MGQRISQMVAFSLCFYTTMQSLILIGILADVIPILKKPNDLGQIYYKEYVFISVYDQILNSSKWAYCLLDEGHKIRNPAAGIS